MNLYKYLFFSLLMVAAGSASAQSIEHLLAPQNALNSSLSTFDRAAQPNGSYHMQPDTTDESQSAEDEFPEPKSVLYKSLIIPGWGQLVNKQAWKIPIVYGLIGGVAAYSIYLTNQYHDYRAAYYNRTHDDMMFGPTPSYIPESVSDDALRNTRNQLRNRRDFSYLAIVLAYGLNAVDAYVFAHMRSFDVSEDLSMKAGVHPTLLADSSPGLTLSIRLSNK